MSFIRHARPALARSSPQDRAMLIQMADLGGQYYSRFNVEDAAQPWDSVTHF